MLTGLFFVLREGKGVFVAYIDRPHLQMHQCLSLLWFLYLIIAHSWSLS